MGKTSFFTIINGRFTLYAMLLWLVISLFDIPLELWMNYVNEGALGNFALHILHIAIQVIMIFVIVYIFLSKIKQPYNLANLFLISTLWVMLTIIQGFLVETFVFAHPFEVFFQKYNLIQGGLKLLFLASEYGAPMLLGQYFILKRGFNIHKP